MYHAPNQMYYFRGDDWAGLTESQRMGILNAVRAVSGLATFGGSVYGHRKKGVDWYCTILASLVWSGLAAEVTARITGFIVQAATGE